jgi:hypothetical protein
MKKRHFDLGLLDVGRAIQHGTYLFGDLPPSVVRLHLTPRAMTEAALKPAPKPENIWLNLAFNVVLPSVILSTMSKPEQLGPLWGMLVGLAFPLGYGIYDVVRRRKANALSIIGIVSILISGGFGLMKIGSFGFAIKEAAIPAVLGLAIIISLKTKAPLVRAFLYNDQLMDVATVHAHLEERQAVPAFERLMVSSTWLLAASMFLSAILNFILARIVLKSEPGTTEFTQEMGKMSALSWPVITLPAFAIMIYALWRLLKHLTLLTGLPADAILRSPPPKEKPVRADRSESHPGA